MLDILRGLDFCFSILTIFKSFQLFGNFDGFTRTSTIHVSGLSPKRRSFKVRVFEEKVQEGQILYDSIATVGEIRVYRRADFQSGSRVLKKVF